MQQKYLTIKSSIHEYEALPHNLKPEDQKAPSAYTFIFTACKSHLRSQPGIFMLVRNKGIAEWNFLIQWNYLEVFISPQECFFLLVLDTANSFISKSCYNYKAKEDSKSHFLRIYMLNIKWSVQQHWNYITFKKSTHGIFFWFFWDSSVGRRLQILDLLGNENTKQYLKRGKGKNGFLHQKST